MFPLATFLPEISGVAAAAVILSAVLIAVLIVYRRRFRAALRERMHTAELIDNLHDGIYRSSLDGHQLAANRALVRLNGYDSEAEMLASVNDIAKEWYVDPNRRTEFQDILGREGRIENFVSEVYRHKTRERIWITESARIVRHPATGKSLYYEGSVREITETIRRQQLEEQIQKLTSQLPGGLFQFRRSQNGSYSVEYLSGSFGRVLGLPEEMRLLTTVQFIGFIIREDRPAYFRSLTASRRSLSPWDHEFRVRNPDGELRWLRVVAKPEQDEGAITWHGYLMDISARKKQAMEIEELAYFDPLTQLPNRRMLRNRTAAAITCARKRGRVGALLFIDLDNFKNLNDSQGHHVGDQYLVQVASRLRECAGENGMVSRMGGDEFVIMLEDLADGLPEASRHALAVADKTLSALRDTFVLGPVHHRGSASIGVVAFDGSESGAEELIRRADIAMYEAKGGGRDGISLFDPASLELESQRFRLLNDLRAAISGDQLALHFQPQIDREGHVCGAEALLRWRHPELGDIPPAVFIPLAEHCGLIHEIGNLVLAKGIATLAGWQKNPETSYLRLAVNISVQSFANATFAPDLTRLVGEHGVDASYLTLEFAENVMARDHERTATHMAELKKLGIRFSLDDFGTGYSSLVHLKKLPFDELKIDGSFVADIETRESDRALVRTILAMATTLGLSAVAEHVEDDKQRIFLHLFGCEMFQGLLYSAAVPEKEFLAFTIARNAPSETETADIRRPA
ncbi:MAG: EAL domain-containing protein [Hyphomicrobiales bacterium]|nr:EAL domain-containing protein [Hyphomicrobiales bacterium]